MKATAKGWNDVRKTAQRYRVDFDGNRATGGVGQTVTSSMGDSVRFVKRGHYFDNQGRPVETLLIIINGTPGLTLCRGLYYQGKMHNDFDILSID